MGIIPPIAKDLTEVYEDLVDAAGTLTGAAAQIAPAAVRQVLCESGNFLDLFPKPIDGLLPPGSTRRTLEDLGGILQQACPVPPPLPSPGGFEEGQCAGVFYIVDYELERKNRLNCARLENLVGSRELEGPVRNFRFINPDIADCDFGGTPYIDLIANFGPDQQTTTIERSFGDVRFLSFKILSIRRKDGLPDECGEPLPSPPQPPIPDLPESPIIPDDRPGGGGGGYIFKPTVGPIFIGPDGDINVPVVINVGGPSLNIPVTIPVNVSLPDFNPTVVIGGGGGVAPPGTPSNPDDPPTPPPPICCKPPSGRGEEKEGDEDEPVETDDPPEGLELIGVIVKSSVNSERTRATRLIGRNGAPDLWVPRIASIYFKLDDGGASSSGQSTFSIDFDVKMLSQFIPAPTGAKFSGAVATPQGGVALSIEPIFRPTNEKSPD